MTLSIFDLLGELINAGWHLIAWIAEVLWKLASGSIHIGFQFLSAVCEMLLSPFSWGVGQLWSLREILFWVLTLLLAACALLTLGVVAKNAYQKYHRR